MTGEHGTGLAKKPWLELQRGARAVEVMRSIKAALDPDGLFNPGQGAVGESVQAEFRRQEPASQSERRPNLSHSGVIRADIRRRRRLRRSPDVVWAVFGARRYFYDAVLDHELVVASFPSSVGRP